MRGIVLVFANSMPSSKQKWPPLRQLLRFFGRETHCVGEKTEPRRRFRIRPPDLLPRAAKADALVAVQPVGAGP